jgi:CheY-like chemotaxis protein
MVTATLQVLGYRVLEASNGKAAIKLWESHGGDVALLLTDMVMPEGVSGLALAEHFSRDKPDLRTIVTSGYSEQLVGLHGPQSSHVRFLPKPFTAEQLAVAVRNGIDGK